MKRKFLFCVAVVITVTIQAQLKTYTDGTTLMFFIGERDLIKKESTRGVAVLYPNDCQFLGTIYIFDDEVIEQTPPKYLSLTDYDFSDAEILDSDTFHFRKSCGYEADTTKQRVMYLGGEIAQLKIDEAQLCAIKWEAINEDEWNFEKFNYVHKLYSQSYAREENESFQFNSNHTGVRRIEVCMDGYCYQRTGDGGRAVGSNQYATKYKSSGGTGGYFFLLMAPIYEDFKWEIVQNTLMITVTNKRIGSVVVTPDTSCDNCEKEFAKWKKQYVLNDYQSNPEVNEKKREFRKYLSKIDLTERHKYEYNIGASNKKYVILNEGELVLKSPKATRSEIIEWLKKYQNIINTLIAQIEAASQQTSGQ